MTEVCPLRMLAQDSIGGDADKSMEIVEYAENRYIERIIGCLKEDCAWWNEDFDCCSITALARVATRPIAIEEQLGHD